MTLVHKALPREEQRDTRKGLRTIDSVGPDGDADGVPCRMGEAIAAERMRSEPLNPEIISERLFHAVVSGQRQQARGIIEDTLGNGFEPREFAHEILWEVVQQVAHLYRQDQISTLAHNYATRMLRSIVDRMAVRYDNETNRGRRVLMFTGDADADEIAGHLMADILEAEGYEVWFGGGGVSRDEVLAEVGARRPDTLLMFASAARDAPDIRLLIDTIRGVGANPEMQIVVGGGVFNRADGLAEEIGADAWAREPIEVLEILDEEPDRRATADQRTVGRNRRAPAKPARSKVA